MHKNAVRWCVLSICSLNVVSLHATVFPGSLLQYPCTYVCKCVCVQKHRSYLIVIAWIRHYMKIVKKLCVHSRCEADSVLKAATTYLQYMSLQSHLCSPHAPTNVSVHTLACTYAHTHARHTHRQACTHTLQAYLQCLYDDLNAVR